MKNTFSGKFMKQYILFMKDRGCIIAFFFNWERNINTLPFRDKGKERDLGVSRSFIFSPDRGKSQELTGKRSLLYFPLGQKLPEENTFGMQTHSGSKIQRIEL